MLDQDPERSENSGSARKSSTRRMGDRDAPTAQTILDGAERVLQASGYGAITARSVAQEAGVKHQLVYYYFNDVDDLLLAAFKRRMDRGLDRLRQDAVSDRPVRAIWDDFSNAISAWLDFEYMALANHHDGVRQEIVRFQTEARAIQIEAIEKAYGEARAGEPRIPPAALAFLITWTAMALARERGTGFTQGHAEVTALMEQCFLNFEPHG
jgi:AcrR family transcriptional regulator